MQTFVLSSFPRCYQLTAKKSTESSNNVINVYMSKYLHSNLYILIRAHLNLRTISINVISKLIKSSVEQYNMNFGIHFLRAL